MRRTWSIAAAAALLFVAACGGDDDSDDGGTATTPAAETTAAATTEPATTAPATTAAGTTAPGTTGGGDSPATTAATAPTAGGNLDPQPLPERTTITSVRSSRLEGFAQIFLADVMGEFEKENIEIEYADVSTQPDGLVVLASGDADMMPTSPTAGVLNAIDGGSEIKMVAPIFSPNPESKAGLWLTNDALGDATAETFDVASLKGMKLGASGGAGSTLTYWFRQFLAEGGLTLSDVTLELITPTDLLIALENGAVDGAFVNDPLWIQVETGGHAQLIATQPPGVSLGGIFFGPSLLNEDPAVGQAVFRALARTTEQYLQGDYHQDPEVVAALVGALEIPEENLLRTPSLVFDPAMEIPDGFIQELQEGFIEDGSLAYDSPAPESDIVDRSFRDAVLG